MDSQPLQSLQMPTQSACPKRRRLPEAGSRLRVFELTIDTFSIIFVHGLTGKRQSTWTHANGLCWPLDLLPGLFPRARILTFGYDADVVRLWNAVGANTLRDHGKSLAAAVADAQPATGQRRIVFVAHSLGGLVVEQALLLCRWSNEPRLNRVIEDTIGVLFMGTPHQGSHLAGWGQTAAKLVNYLRSSNDRIVGDLNPRSEAMLAVNEDFQQMLMHKDISIHVWCLYEEDPMAVVGKVVPDTSAILKQYPNSSVKANHKEMTKFNGSDDPGFHSVKGILTEWLGTESTNPGTTTLGPGVTNEPSEEPPPDDAPHGESQSQRASGDPQAARRAQEDSSLERGGNVYSGNIDARGGNVVQGGQRVDGNITMNFGPPPR